MLGKPHAHEAQHAADGNIGDCQGLSYNVLLSSWAILDPIIIYRHTQKMEESLVWSFFSILWALSLSLFTYHLFKACKPPLIFRVCRAAQGSDCFSLSLFLSLVEMGTLGEVHVGVTSEGEVVGR